jgi:Flp pilus assembly protein TadG
LESNGIFISVRHYGGRTIGLVAMGKMNWASRATALRDCLRRFHRSRQGNVAMMFALALVPLVAAGGAGLDYVRAASVRSQMSEALDAAALAVATTPGLTDNTSVTSAAQKYFDASFGDTSATKPVVGLPTGTTFDASKGTVTLTVSYSEATTLLKVVGIKTVALTTTSTVVWGQSKLWVSLVLDNSGSMSQGDSNGSKMDALQNASHQLLTILQKAAMNQGDVQVSIVPFSSQVKPNLSGTTYIDYREFNAQPPLGTGYMTVTAIFADGTPFQAYGPGDACPFDGTDGYLCASSSTNSNNCSYDNSGGCLSKIASSGTICPGMHGYSKWQDGTADRFYNGCYTSVKATGTLKTISWTGANGKTASCSDFSSADGCSCGGSPKTCTSQRWNHVWTLNSTSTWKGCVTDRQRNGAATYGASAATVDYDISNTTPASTTPDTLFPAVNFDGCLVATVTPLPATWTAAQWTTLGNQIDAMSPGGATNQALGMEHGWQTLTPGAPYNAPALPANTARYIIILSDGLNTQDRWYGTGRAENTAADGNIDTRMNSVCTKAKADGIIVYSIFLDIGGADGNSAPLQNCATDSSKYFDLTSTSAVVTTFNQIAQSITNVRVSK